MKKTSKKEFQVRRANPDEYQVLGKMTVNVYEQLPGMPGPAELPAYYAMLRDAGSRAKKPTVDILVAVTPDDELLGGVTFVGDMKYYDSGGTASSCSGSSGVRLLAVKPEARGYGVGRSLTEACIHRAVDRGSSQVILHTTQAMKIAWGMYQRMGFRRSPDLDFSQGNLAVFGFRLDVNPINGGRHGRTGSKAWK